MRKCPDCGKPRSETGGAFCSFACEYWYFQGRSEEFEVDVAIVMRDVQRADQLKLNLEREHANA